MTKNDQKRWGEESLGIINIKSNTPFKSLWKVPTFRFRSCIKCDFGQNKQTQKTEAFQCYTAIKSTAKDGQWVCI